MRSTITTLFLLCSFSIFAHRGEYASIEHVQFEQSGSQTLIQFDIENIKMQHLFAITVDLVVNDIALERLQVYAILSNERFTAGKFLVDSKLINFESDKVQIEIVKLYGKPADWGGWDNPIAAKQVNTLASEFYADAPWRMKKTDEFDSLAGIPVHFFLHDADLLLGLDVQIDHINIQLKNAVDASFDPVLTYSSIPFVDFQNMFSCTSPADGNLDIKEFDLNSFSASGSQTIDFDIDSDIFGEFVGVDQKYWFFTFTIPPSELVGYNDVIDILATIEYSNLTFSDDKIGMRIFRSEQDVPSLTDYYRGDTHLHSMYTQNDAEIGLPLCATKVASALTGMDWVTTTDHTSDFDNYGISINSNWNRIHTEAAALNLLDSSFIYIPALEVAVNNNDDKLVHMLTYPNPVQPTTMPFIGDGDGDLFPTNVTVDEALDSIATYSGFAYLAHPFATGDELAAVPTNGGVWNLGNADFPLNGSNFPLDGGVIICNNTSLASDVLSALPGQLVKDGIKGGQIWNSKYNLITNGDELDPWDVQGNSTPFAQMDTTSIEFHFRRFRQGLEIANHINQLGLQLKNADTNYTNWKLYYSAGTDAHGSFNSSNTGDFASLGSIKNNAVGKLGTVAYCPNGMGTSGENVLTALRDGNTTLSDGPIAVIGMSTNGNDSVNEVLMGEDLVLDAAAFSNSFINLDYTTNTEFGDITKINFYLGTETGEYKRNVSFAVNDGPASLSFQLSELLDSILGVGNTPINAYMYLRAELESEVDYTGLEAEYRASYDIFHSITNPIWFNQYFDDAGINESAQNFVHSYPNPVEDEIHFAFETQASYEIKIHDQAGRIIKTQKGIDKIVAMNLSALASGIYYAKMIVGNKNFLVKFVKQ